MSNILGISAFYHDSAAVLLKNGKVIAAAQEERFTRIKHDPSFPENAIKYCLQEGKMDSQTLDAVVFYDKPLLKFERLLETYYSYAPRGLKSFINAVPVWAKEKLFFKRLLRRGLKEFSCYDPAKTKLLFTEHHQAHAASAFFTSPFQQAAILTIDGVGEWATASICKGIGNKIEIIKELRFPHSLGLLYSAFTYFLGFRVNSGEYKLMGLAPYGIKESSQLKDFKEIILQKLIHINPDGSLWLNQRYFSFSTGLRMVKDKQWEKLLGIEKRQPESTLLQSHANLALAIQQITEEVVLRMARHAKEITQEDNLCLAGGVALNCVANGKLLAEQIFDQIFIQPAAGDAGGALGAALAAYYAYFGNDWNPQKLSKSFDPYLGPAFTSKEIMAEAKKRNLQSTQFDSHQLLCSYIAEKLGEGNVVGWFQGRMEWGPRALGNRSILADPRNESMQQRINLKIKRRESFRPFAPAILAQHSTEYFALNTESPYMLLVAPVNMDKRNPIPNQYENLSLSEKLSINKSVLPSITHVDFSARVQTVTKDCNPLFAELLEAFYLKTGIPVLINTSFNVRGEPIVCLPAEALDGFLQTEMDILAIGNHVFQKRDF